LLLIWIRSLFGKEMRVKKTLFLSTLLVLSSFSFLSAASDRPETPREAIRSPLAFDAIGSWFGRAVPFNPPCEPGTQGCPLPKEIVMLPTFFADGNFIGIDSQTFGGGSHTTAHGQWKLVGRNDVWAEFVFLQSAADTFIGGFRMRMKARPTGPNTMVGKINAYFFPFTDASGEVIIDPETGYPNPDPLQPLGDFAEDFSGCDPAAGCVGVFEFTIRRVKPQ